MAKFKTGDRVVIKSSEHPWNGHSGVVSDEWIVATKQWVIELDNGVRAGATASELELVNG